MITNIKIDDIGEKMNGNKTIYMRFNYLGHLIGVTVEQYKSGDIYLYNDDIQIFEDEGNWNDFDYSEFEYDYFQDELQKFVNSL